MVTLEPPTSDDPRYLAHPQHPLATHLAHVSNRAKKFAKHFQAEAHAELAGLLHDLGKADESFQKRMEAIQNNKKDPGGKQPHAPHGASLLLEPPENHGGPVWPAAFAIFGHHAGLHNRSDLMKCLRWRDKALKFVSQLPANDPGWNGTQWPIKDFGKNLPDWLDALPNSTPQERAAKLRAVDLYIRFLFSALIDADRLDTEQHDPETRDNFAKRHNWRFGEAGLAAKEATNQLLAQLNEAITKRREAAQKKGASQDVLKVRADVLKACATAAGKPRGIFTLTVPTGGGKTLASVFFALQHIAHHNALLPEDDPRRLRRIIVVIPFLNIIQQTAEELKDVFNHTDDDPIVLEHHSQAQDPEPPSGKKAETGDSDDYSRERTLRQLAAENWDAPIVVTTSVQFFDSLFSRRPADARKLHNIAQSVIIFDEAQTFPPRLMQPILDVLGELTNPQRPYGCSLVLCTATQPALSYDEDDLRCGLSNWRRNDAGQWEREALREIIPNPVQQFHILKRTNYQWIDTPLSWEALAEELKKQKQALVIVNTRRHARELFEAVREKIADKESDARPDFLYHLSTWMTPAHRLEVLAEVRRRLEKNEQCFLVSTQCIEAGVDVDFPAVWRALGPYDAIVQAAGRCNRNGRLTDANGNPALGEVHVFRPEDDALPPGVYQTATNQTELLRKYRKPDPNNPGSFLQESAADPHDPQSFETYFRFLYQLSVPDVCEIQQHREQLRFEEVSNLFNFIESFTVPVIIAEYEPGNAEVSIKEMCENASQKGYFTPDEWRQIQPHIVQLDYRDKKTAKFNKNNTAKMFKQDDDLTGLRRLTHFCAYDGGLHGCGLDVDQVGSFETVL